MDLASLRAQQIELASSVIREDRLDKDPPDLIAGADVGFEQGGEVTRAAMVLLKYPSLELVEYKVARIATTMPYIPGFLSFREYPALLAAWEMQMERKHPLLKNVFIWRITKAQRCCSAAGSVMTYPAAHFFILINKRSR